MALFLPFCEQIDFYPTAPFNFDATLHKPSHFPSTDNFWEPGVRWQTMLWQGTLLGLKFENRGTVDQPRMQVSVWSQSRLEPDFIAGLEAELRYRYNLDLDLEPFNRALASDPQLGPVLDRWRGTRPMSYCSLYEYLIVAIVLQNATVRRSVNMLQALFDAYGARLAYDGKEFSAYWSPERLAQASEEELRRLKVGYRAKSFVRVTQAFVQGQIDEMRLRSASIEEQRKSLLSLYGVGPASVGYILSDVFHRWSAMSHISPWEQKIYSRLFFDVDPETPVPVEKLKALFAERFSGYEGLAVGYIWEDLFWRRKHEPVDWLERLIRL